MLSSSDFIQAVKLTQVVSVDFICRDPDGKFLLGKRVNEPAKNYWFVPGGRVYKGETVTQGIPRISRHELGFPVDHTECKFIGVNDHIYNNNFLSQLNESGEMIPTHYVCLAYETPVNSNSVNRDQFLQQHSDLRWMTKEEILSRSDVHEYTKKYFTGEFNWA